MSLLTPIGPDIWLSDGPDISAALGFHFPTRMCVIRLTDGGVVLWSPTAFRQDLLAEITALGPVVVLIAPNDLHHMALPDWVAACPDAGLHGAPGLASKRKDLSFDLEILDEVTPRWSNDLDHVVIANKITTEVVFFHHSSGTVIFTDLIQKMPSNWYRGWRKLVAQLDLMTAPTPTVPRKYRMGFGDKTQARAQIRRVLDWPVQILVMAHGPVVTKDAAGTLRRAFDWLKP